MSAIPYLEHFTDVDLALLAAATETTSITELLHELQAGPERLEAALGAASTYRMVFGGDDPLLRASPFLVFAVLVHRAARDLGEAHFVEEWVSPGRRVPMFEVSGVRDVVSTPARRLFLAELLASYTHVASGTMWVKAARGWRRRRYSELDPLRLIELLEVVPEEERPQLFRRLGDLALFLTGVFPDHVGGGTFAPIQRQRLKRVLRRMDEESPDLAPGVEDWPLERVGRRAYDVAGRAFGPAGIVLREMADNFGEARRFLNVLTDRYLFPHRDRWFSQNG